MFLKIQNQLLNIDNFQYYEYENEILSLNFNGNLNSKIKQNLNQYNEFISFIKENKNFFISENIGINIKNISGVVENQTDLIVYFVDGSNKKYDRINFLEFEKQLLGE